GGAARGRHGQVFALPAAGGAAVLARRGEPALRRAGARPVRLRRAQPALRHSRRRATGDRLGRSGQRDGAGRVWGRVRRGTAAGASRTRRPCHPRRVRRQARSRRLGTPRPRLRDRRGRPGRRARPLPPRAPGAAGVKKLFWGSAAAPAWTHVGDPLAAALAARLRPDPVARADVTPSVTLIVAAWNEEDVIARRLENLLELDYPADRLEIVVASDASDDRTDAIVEEFSAREPRV